MSTVTLSTVNITRIREVFTLYTKKAAFFIEEYSDVGAVYKRMTELPTDKETAEVSEMDVKYLVNIIKVCSSRVPTEAQNLKPIADLIDTLESSLKKPEELSKIEEVDEETKEEC